MMKPLTYVGMTAALCWAGVLASAPVEQRSDAELIGRRLLSRLQARHRNATANYAQLGVRQTGTQCGGSFGRCPNDLCCSEYGWCGDSIDHCHPLFNCQTQYGVCGWPKPTPTFTTTSSTTTSTTTTSSTTTTTSSSTTTTTTSRVILPSSSTTSTSVIPTPTGPLVVTTNGQCGNNTICIGNPNFGPCCSQFFWCGSSIEYCGAGCQSQFGACFGVPGIPAPPPSNGTSPTTSSTSQAPPGTPSTTSTTTSSSSSTTTSSTASPTPTVTIPPGMVSTTDGRCGNGVTCLGSTWGRCCSQFGWCGNGDQYCGWIAGCQPEFGDCDPAP